LYIQYNYLNQKVHASASQKILKQIQDKKSDILEDNITLGLTYSCWTEFTETELFTPFEDSNNINCNFLPVRRYLCTPPVQICLYMPLQRSQVYWYTFTP